MTDISPESLAARLDGITEGPWHVRTLENFGFNVVQYIGGDKHNLLRVGKFPTGQDAAFVTWAREAVPALAAKAAESRNNGIREALSAIASLRRSRNILAGTDCDDNRVLLAAEHMIRDLLTPAPEQEPEAHAPADSRPANCRERLREAGKSYPRGGCSACGTNLFTGLKCLKGVTS